MTQHTSLLILIDHPLPLYCIDACYKTRILAPDRIQLTPPPPSAMANSGAAASFYPTTTTAPLQMLLFLLLLLLMGGGVVTSALPCLESERSALLDLKAANPVAAATWLSSWSGRDCCGWSGVRCFDGNTTTTPHVTELHLHCPDTTFDGTCLTEVRPSLVNLTRLKHLDLSFNNFSGAPIPAVIGSLAHLHYLNLSGAGFGGPIPHHIGNISGLRFLDLSRSDGLLYVDDGLHWLSPIHSLQHLDMSGVNLTTATYWLRDITTLSSLKVLRLSASRLQSTLSPHQAVNLSSLVTLDLSGNSFASTVPNWLFQLGNLESLDLSFNGFHGRLPSDVNMSSSLSILDLSYNSFTSTIPPWLFNTSVIYTLDLSWNSLDGVSPISEANVNLNRLEHLFLSVNSITGGISEIIDNFKHLITLDLSANGITGEIPESMGNMSSLEHLDLSYNQITGEIPESMGNMSSLEHLDLNSNQITGEIPESMGNMSSLEHLDLNYNQITGKIPTSIGNQRNLVNLYLSHNQINGPVPETIGNLGKLREFDLSNNKISGKIPETLTNLHKLEELHMGGNMIKGRIPKGMGNLKKLVYLDISGNKISGQIPEAIGELNQLQGIDMSSNQITGQIPEAIGELNQLQIIDMSGNQITGQIPASLGGVCALGVLDLSNNYIAGEITGLVDGLSRCNVVDNQYRDPGLTVDLSNNRLNGSIPKSLGRLSWLYGLNLTSNYFTGQLIEDHFANLTGLSVLDLSYNNKLEFNVSQKWSPPFNAFEIHLCACRLGPGFPIWLQYQTQLEDLCLSEAEISDKIPAWLGVSYLSSYLNISHNNITGELPDSLRKHSLVVFDASYNRIEGLLPNFAGAGILDLRNNSFSGPIPMSYSGADSIRYLGLSHNHINGSIPRFLCHKTHLEILDLSNNDMSGEIPDCWNKTQQLRVVDLSSNTFSGFVPHTFGFLAQLESLHLGNNSLSGGIPRPMKSCTGLVMLDLGKNMLSGIIPRWLGESLSSLQVLRLRSNSLKGSVPVSLSLLHSLRVLDVAHNNLSGNLFPSFGNFTAMAIRSNAAGKQILYQYVRSYSAPYNGFAVQSNYGENLLMVAKGIQLEYTKMLISLVTNIDMSSNNLGGEIPKELANLHGLHFLNLSANQFVGQIPIDIGGMEQLESLDLSNNHFSGGIPPTLLDLNFLSGLNLSNNNLSGRIPSGKQLQTFTDPSIYAGNQDLCGWPLSDCNSSSNGHSKDDAQEEEDRSETIWIYASSALGFIIGFWAFVGTVMVKRATRIAYFRCTERMYDWIYVHVAVFFNKIKSSTAKNN